MIGTRGHRSGNKTGEISQEQQPPAKKKVPHGHRSNPVGSEVDGESTTRFVGPHPLLIPHIIENVFGYLFANRSSKDDEGSNTVSFVPDFKNCRLVSSKWNEEAVKYYKKHQTAELIFGQVFALDEKKNGLEKYLKDMANCVDCPIQNYRFDPGFFIEKNKPIFKQFLFSCSDWIVSLRLWFDTGSNLRFPKRCYPNLNLPNLEYLSFGCVTCRLGTSIDRIEYSYILEALLNAAKNLKRFACSFPPRDTKSQKCLIQRLSDVVTQKCPKSVNNLKLELKLEDSHLQAFLKLNLRLETLHIDFRGSVLRSETIYNLLSQNSATLVDMKLIDSEMKYEFELKFPTFKQLSVLEIQGGRISALSYKQNFPCLEKLLLFGWEDEPTSKSMLQSPTVCQSLRSLELPYRIKNKQLVFMADNCFPNLRKLEVTVSEEGLDALISVFQSLVNLEELAITFPFIIGSKLPVDSTFTGLSPEACEALMLGGDILRNVELEKISQSQPKPNSIANLTKLKRLSILDHSNEVRLTDVTVLFGFSLIKNLETLVISRFNMSDKVLKLLKADVKVRKSSDEEEEDASEELSFSGSDDDEDEEDDDAFEFELDLFQSEAEDNYY